MKRKILENCPISGFADEIHFSFSRQLETLTRLGISWLELRCADGIGIADMTIPQAREYKKMLDARGIQISAIGSPIGKIGINQAFEPHMESLAHIADLADIMECRNVRIFSFYIPMGQEPESWRGQVLTRMGQMVKLAEKRDLILLHENEKDIYGDTAARCRELTEQFEGPHFGCTFDFANFVQCGQDTREAYRLLAKSISHVHVKDARMADGSVTVAGEGDGHVPELLGRLAADGFQGFLSLEPHLIDFAGFSGLEQKAEQKAAGDGARAFEQAYRALEAILAGTC